MTKKALSRIFTSMNNFKSAIQGNLFYRALSSAIHLPGRAYRWLQYRQFEKTHRFSVRFSRRTGVSITKREPELIISLTTIPERIGFVAISLDSLLRQSLKPDRVILWLSESNEPGCPPIGRQSLPPDLQRLMQRGLEIRWCKDIRSFRKIIPTLRAHPEAIIVTADDDIIYPRHWLRMLYEAYQREPQFIHCHRAHLMQFDATGAALPYRQWQLLASGHMQPSKDLLPTGCGGVLYAPGHLHPEVLNEQVFMSLCPKADDAWLKAMSLMVNVACKKVTAETFTMIEIRIPNNRTLNSENLYRDGNDPQIKAVAEYYGVFHQ
jgi:hypothetical protein